LALACFKIPLQYSQIGNEKDYEHSHRGLALKCTRAE